MTELLRQVTIPRDRLQSWMTGFSDRHGSASAQTSENELILAAPDGAEARIEVPFPPVDLIDDPQSLAQHVMINRRVGAVLARKGGFAVGIFDGDQLVESKVGSSYVQGKTKAGGWSQQRYARRRDNQSKKAYAEASTVTAQLLLPEFESLVGVATGGDKGAISAVFDDPRLEPLRPLLSERVLPTPDPRLRILQSFGDQFLAVRIGLNELA